MSKRLKPFYPEEDFIKVIIDWDGPYDFYSDEYIEKANDYVQAHTWFYKYSIKFNNQYKLKYVGKVEDTVGVLKRLASGDHYVKRDLIYSEHRNHALYVSFGIINKEKNEYYYKTIRKNIRNIENLLIYSHSHKEDRKVDLLNNKNANWHHVKKQIYIENNGFLKDGMHKKVSFGLFTS